MPSRFNQAITIEKTAHNMPVQSNDLPRTALIDRK